MQGTQRVSARFVHDTPLHALLPATLDLLGEILDAAFKLGDALAPATDDVLPSLAFPSTFVETRLQDAHHLVLATKVDLVLRAEFCLKRQLCAEGKDEVFFARCFTSMNLNGLRRSGRYTSSRSVVCRRMRSEGIFLLPLLRGSRSRVQNESTTRAVINVGLRRNVLLLRRQRSLQHRVEHGIAVGPVAVALWLERTPPRTGRAGV